MTASTQKHVRSNSSQSESGISLAQPTCDLENKNVVLTEVTPARSTWLPQLLTELLPEMVRATKRAAFDHEPMLLTNQRDGLLPVTLNEEYGVTGVGGWYAFAATDFVMKHGDSQEEWSKLEQKGRSPALNTLTKVGIGRDSCFSGLEDLETGPVQLLKLCSDPPEVVLSLDETKWRETRPSQRKKGLETFSILSKACSIEIVASPSLEKFLYKKHPAWWDTHLTETCDSAPPHYNVCNPDQRTIDPEKILSTLRSYTPNGGRVRLLAAIPAKEGEYREVRELKQDPQVNSSAGTVDRYYRELERDDGFLAVNERGRYNSVTLTSRGRYAQKLITDDYQIRHPAQLQLTTDHSTPRQSDTSLVCRVDAPKLNDESPPVDKCLASNTKPPKDGPASLSLKDSWLSDADLMHRFTAGSSGQGITLINGQIAEFSEGRTTFLGYSDDEVQVVLQWGNPLPTLVRLATTLLSEKAFEEILKPSLINPLLTRKANKDEPSSLDILRLGRQLGWLPDQEYDHRSIKREYIRLGKKLLKELSYRGQDRATWTRLCKDAHGLLASATHLYDAAGLDITFHIRVPDTNQLTRDKTRYQKFINFFKYTVPKNAVYEGNSANRLLLEVDGDKLKYRLPVDIDEEASNAELTANWVITGPNVTTFQADIVKALRSIPIRDQIKSGSEQGIVIPVEVAKGNSYNELRRTTESILRRLNLSLADELDLETLVRIYWSTFEDVTKERPTSSPFTIVESLLAANQVKPEGESLTTETVLKSLGAVPSAKLYPWLPPSARKFTSALFWAQKPMKRSEITESAGISKSSYHRYRGVLLEANLIEESSPNQYSAVAPALQNTRISSGQNGGSSVKAKGVIKYKYVLDQVIDELPRTSRDDKPCVKIGEA